MKYSLTDYEILANHFDWLADNQVLVSLIGGRIGIATKNERGYNPTSATYSGTYRQGAELVEKANAIIHPDMSAKDRGIIVLRSMRK